MTGRKVLFRFFVLSLLLIFLLTLSVFDQRRLDSHIPKSHKTKSLSSGYDQDKHPPYARYGVLGVPEFKDKEDAIKILYNIGYVNGFSEKKRVPLWSAYRLGESAFFEEYKRYSNWYKDLRVENCPEPADYNYSLTKKHRGHLAPSYAMNRAYGTIAMVESFSMTNATPMSERLNTGIWAALENQVFGNDTSWASDSKEIWIICGPIFDDDTKSIGNNIKLPKEYFKIILRDANDRRFNEESYECLAFRFPETGVETEQTLSQFLCSIDSIETDTGLDLFVELDDDKEAQLEALVADAVWY